MNVISKSILLEKAARHADANVAVLDWLGVAKQADWHSLDDIRKTYPATDMVGALAIFNIRGNRYRLIVRMSFKRRRIYIKEFLTHAEYDKGGWKKWLP